MLVFLEFGAIIIATTSSCPFYHPYRYPTTPLLLFFYFLDYQQIANAAFLRTEMKKILSLSEHEPSELHNSNTESHEGISFFSNKFMARRHPISLPQIWIWWHQYLQIYTLFVWKQHVPPFAPEFPLHQIPQEPWQNSQTNPPNTVDYSIPEQKHLWYYFDVPQSKYLHLDDFSTH